MKIKHKLLFYFDNIKNVKKIKAATMMSLFKLMEIVTTINQKTNEIRILHNELRS